MRQILFALITGLPGFAQAPLHREDFRQGLSRWVVEQRPGGRVSAKDGLLRIEDKDGCTVWFRPRLQAPVVIRFQATVVDRGGPLDRVSDLNVFWMASDPKGELFRPGHGRDGAFTAYDGLRLYYVGCGGNDNTTTRFRRYRGDGTKPLLPEHDLREPRFLLEGNRTYTIELRADGQTASFLRDGKVFFQWKDPAPLTSGWFGFRTFHAHLELRDFQVWSGAPR